MRFKDDIRKTLIEMLQRTNCIKASELAIKAIPYCKFSAAKDLCAEVMEDAGMVPLNRWARRTYQPGPGTLDWILDNK